MRKRLTSLSSERGAVLVQVAVASFVLVGFGTFVVDYGVLWASRHQAQNAADAGAMAGALARAYEDYDDPPALDGVAAQNAARLASSNAVWGESATSGVTFPDVDPQRLVRVDAYRNGENGSTSLPIWFGPLLGINSQGVKATATAQVTIPNATNCLRPWAIPDKFVNVTPGPEFTKYNASGVTVPNPDVYNSPSAVGPGTGFVFPTSNAQANNPMASDLGALIAMTRFTHTPVDLVVPGLLVPLEPALPATYASSIDSCNGQTVKVGDLLNVSLPDSPPSLVPFGTLFEEDSLASWNAGTRTIDGSCAPGCAPISPRLVSIAVFNTDLFQYRLITGDWSACPAGMPCTPCPGGAFSPCISVVNIVGFFIIDASPAGYLTTYPGLVPTEAPLLSKQSSFLKAVTLVR